MGAPQWWKLLIRHVPSRGTVLLTGATGFVGRYVHQPLVEAGWAVRCSTRDVPSAQARWPDRDWVRLDVTDAASVEQALQVCDAALYLIHGMASLAQDFRQTEIHQAQTFSSAAARARLKRITYLGGVAADVDPSDHLKSREEVGEALRAHDSGPVPLPQAVISLGTVRDES